MYQRVRFPGTSALGLKPISIDRQNVSCSRS